MIAGSSKAFQHAVASGKSSCRGQFVRSLSTRSSARSQHTSSQASPTKESPSISPRWLSETKARVGKCVMFGLNHEQAGQAAHITKVLGEDWRELLAGSEGFLTSDKRAGLLRHNVVWGEMDFMQHVNNVTYVRYAESARLNWIYNFAMHIDPEHREQWSDMWTPKAIGMILGSIRTDYKFPMVWPDKVSVFHKLSTVPTSDTSAFTLDVMILSEKEQRPAARCVESIVMYDYRIGKKTTFPPFMLEAFKNLWEEQKTAQEKNTAKLLSLFAEVRALEKDSWDKADVVEDFGNEKRKNRASAG